MRFFKFTLKFSVFLFFTINIIKILYNYIVNREMLPFEAQEIFVDIIISIFTAILFYFTFNKNYSKK